MNTQQLLTSYYNTVMGLWGRFERPLTGSAINYYFCASYLIIVGAVLIKLPSLVTSAEFYAETATIFFFEARESSIWSILTYTWADYLVTFQLLVSYVLVRFFGVTEFFPGTVNFLFLLFVAFSASLINLRIFRNLIDSDFLRFMVGLSIGLVPNFEYYELLHSNLFGFTIYLFFIFVDKKQLNALFFYLIVILLFLVGIARPNMVAFWPVYVVLITLAVKKREVRDIIFYGAGIISLTLQSYVMIMAQLYWSVRKTTGIYNEIHGLDSLFAPLHATVNHYFRTMLGVVFNQQINGTPLILTLIAILMVLIVGSCYYLYRNKRFEILYFFGLCQVLVIGLLYFVAFSSPVTIDWTMMRYDTMRWWAYSNFIMYLSLMVLAYNTAREILANIRIPELQDFMLRGAVMGMALLPVVFHIHPFYRYVDQWHGPNSVSHWSKYRHLMQEEDFYIPTNPVQHMQWGVWRDNRILNTSVKIDHDTSGILIPETQGELKLRSMIIVNDNFYDRMKDLIVKAYDKSGKEIAIPRRLNDLKDKYLYYYFTERVRPYKLLFFNEDIERVKIRPALHMFGKLEPTESIVITEAPD